jgi:hypothetical protein
VTVSGVVRQPGVRVRCGVAVAAALCALASIARADTVLTFKFTPAPRAQIAIWIEDERGHFATVALTESVAYRGIGNRPGASEMNSGYRWPYGRREGVLPIWAHHRAAVPGALLFRRVIFQDRIEGLASRTKTDQSVDNYYCLQFDDTKAKQDNLDAVSCASVFNSDKGRYMGALDLANQYSEPWEDKPPMAAGKAQPLPLASLYPPRLDVVARCNDGMNCYDHADVDSYIADARAVMPEIDSVSMATPPGGSPQRVLFTVPKTWPTGKYSAYIEVNLEGDYNDRWNATTYPTPKTPEKDWDWYSTNYGYAYRGQPSLVWKVDVTLSGSTTQSFTTAQPIGRSSWEHWSSTFGEIEPISFDPQDPAAMSDSAANSGTGRLVPSADGQRFEVQTRYGTVAPVKDPPSHDAGSGSPPPTGTAGAGMPSPGLDAGVPSVGSAGGPATPGSTDTAGSGASDTTTPGTVTIPSTPTSDDDNSGTATVGPIADFSVSHDDNPLRAHTWVKFQLRAAASTEPLNAYDVRVATEPITDETTFIRAGRQAKNATDAAEGATLLTLPVDVPAGEWIRGAIGDLSADTHYWIGVRATDELNQHGEISVAQITTTKREFATVTPCFVATAAYGSPMAAEVSVLRRLRDRYLMPQALGRAAVAGYYRVGGWLAARVRPHDEVRAIVRTALSPLVALARSLRD